MKNLKLFNNLTSAKLLKGLAELFYPRTCTICHHRLFANEELICTKCLSRLPYTGLRGQQKNFIDRILWDDQIFTQRCNSLLYYQQESDSDRLFFQFKYRHDRDLAIYLGRLMAQDLQATDFFKGIDAMIPIPLSATRLKERGYNQSEMLALGINRETGIPVFSDVLTRPINTATQTHMSDEERQRNVSHIFALQQPGKIKGRHVLFIDDVITTGSTMRAAIHACIPAGDLRISVISLAVSPYHMKHTYPPDFNRIQPLFPFGPEDEVLP